MVSVKMLTTALRARSSRSSGSDHSGESASSELSALHSKSRLCGETLMDRHAGRLHDVDVSDVHVHDADGDLYREADGRQESDDRQDGSFPDVVVRDVDSDVF